METVGLHRVLIVRPGSLSSFLPGARGREVPSCIQCSESHIASGSEKSGHQQDRVAVTGAHPSTLGTLLSCRSHLRDLGRVSALASFRLP